MPSYSLIAERQLEAIGRLQNQLLSQIEASPARLDSSEIASYLGLIEKALPLFGILPQDYAEKDAIVKLNHLLSLILNEPEGNTDMINQARFDAAVAKLNQLKSDAADDEENKKELAQAKADLQAAQEAVAPLQAKVDMLTADATDDEENKAALAQAKTELQAAQEALAAAESKTNALIDQILPSDTPAAPNPEQPVL